MTEIPVNQILQGDALTTLKILPSESVDCVISSPPYWALRDYGVAGQLGLEPTFQEYITRLCDIFDEVKRVLKKRGTCWVNMGDTYGGSGKGAGGYSDKSTLAGFSSPNTKGRRMAKESWNFKKAPATQNDVSKSLCQIPSRFAIEMTNRGWILRNEIIWFKPNIMPSSVDDRFTVDFEKMFFFVKNKKYWFEQQFEPYKDGKDVEYRMWLRENKTYDVKSPYKGNTPFAHRAGHSAWRNDPSMVRGKDAVMKVNPNGRNKRTVWKINTKPFSDAHFAVYPEKLIEIPIKAGCPPGGVVLDPFLGSGTTAVVARYLGRQWLGIELNPAYIKIAEDRLAQKMLF